MVAINLYIIGTAFLTLTAGDRRNCECENDLMDCSSRGKTSLDPQEICRNTKKVALFSNMFRQFPDGLNTALFVDVNISSNALTSLPNAAQVNRRIQILDFSYNDISATSNELRTLTNLEVLKISENSLVSIGFLPDPCNLKIFEAKGNAISTLAGPLRKCNKLQILNLSSNRLVQLSNSQFLGLSRLRLIDLSYNPLRQLSPLSFQGLSQLESLFLNDCELITLPGNVFRELGNIKILYLSSNKLVNLPETIFNGLSSLQELNLHSNQIQNIPLSFSSDVRNIQYLWINFNNITQIRSGTFNNLLQLKIINLNGNLINNIPPGAFTNLPSLKQLLLDANQLTNLPNIIDCCNSLEDASFDHNNISRPEETILKRYTSARSLQTSVKYNPIWPMALRWMLEEADYQFRIDPADCACGAVERGGSELHVCVEVQCGRGTRYASWLAAVRGAAG